MGKKEILSRLYENAKDYLKDVGKYSKELGDVMALQLAAMGLLSVTGASFPPSFLAAGPVFAGAGAAMERIMPEKLRKKLHMEVLGKK